MRSVDLFFLILLFSCKENTKKDFKNTESIISPDLAENIQPTTVTEKFMLLMNHHRIELGLLPLILNDDLTSLAIQHSLDMASDVIPFGHTGFSERCSDGYTFLGGGNLCAENVAMGQKSADEVFSAWMNSPGHRANIENQRISHTGFGYAVNENNKFYWTQIFIELNQ